VLRRSVLPGDPSHSGGRGGDLAGGRRDHIYILFYTYIITIYIYIVLYQYILNNIIYKYIYIYCNINNLYII